MGDEPNFNGYQSCCEQEIKILNNSRHQEHILVHAEVDDEDDLPTAISPHLPLRALHFWHSPHTINLPPTMGVNDRISFIIPNCFDMLLSTIYCQPIPSISVSEFYKRTYRIRWSSDLCVRITQSNESCIGSTLLTTFDSMYIKDEHQFNLDASHYDRMMYNIGNRDQLTTWKHSLPRADLSMNHPWFYTRSSNNGFPLHLLEKNSPMIHTILLQREISELIQMQEFDGEWKNMDKVRTDVLTGYGSGKLPLPSMRSTVVKLTDHVKQKQARAYVNRESYIEDVISVSSGKPVKCGKSVELKLSVNDTLINTIYFKAVNNNAILFNDHSNFTMNSKKPWKGVDPIEYVEILYGMVATKLPKTPAHLFSGGSYCQQFKSTPRKDKHGFHAYACGDGSSAPLPGSATNLLNEIIANFDISSYPGSKESAPTFTVHMRCKGSKLIKITDEGRVQIVTKFMSA